MIKINVQTTYLNSCSTYHGPAQVTLVHNYLKCIGLTHFKLQPMYIID